jgi:hypothetical protein
MARTYIAADTQHLSTNTQHHRTHAMLAVCDADGRSRSTAERIAGVSRVASPRGWRAAG